MKLFLMFALTSAVAVGCSHTQKTANKTNEQTRVTADNEMLKSEAIRFEPGSAMLTDSAKTALRSLNDSARARGAIDEAIVAVWSDRDVPVDADLSRADRDLAKERIDVVTSYLKNDLDIRDVDSFNMAERSNWVSRLFNTDDAELKSSYRADSNALTDEELQVIRSRGQPRGATVIFRQDLD